MIGFYLFLFVFSYLLGAIPSGYIITKHIKKTNIFEIGSGNIGATNVYRALGIKWAVFVGAADILKGVIPILLGKYYFSSEFLILFLGLAAVAGHNWSLFLRFRGGRGIATSAGVLLSLMPFSTLIAIGVWVIVLKISRYVSLASIIASLTFPLLAYYIEQSLVLFYFTIILAFWALFQHRSNIKRLWRREENRV